MISFSSYSKSVIKAGLRLLTVIQYGPKTAAEASAFGDDACPLEGLTAVYARTDTNDNPVILGYINKNALAQAGEKRLFSLRPDGSLSTYAWLKNDGTMILAGTGDNLLRYAALNTALQAEVVRLNTELAKIAAAIASLGGAYAITPVTLDISAAKIDQIICPVVEI